MSPAQPGRTATGPDDKMILSCLPRSWLIARPIVHIEWC
jgi:hypothetical protein